MPVEFWAGDQCELLAGLEADSSWPAARESPLYDSNREIDGELRRLEAAVMAFDDITI